MKREFSVYLDAIRFFAALAVFASHMTFPQFSGGIFPYQGDLASAAVVAFFVLSGYVISYVAAEKERSLKKFAVSRLARVYSVAIPALALTIAIDLIGLHQGWTFHAPTYQYAKFPEYLVLTLGFGNQTFLLHEPAFGDGVFWSLDYEVWYYVIFAAATYYGGARRILLVGLFIMIAGPRAILYLPLWLMGAAVYRLHRRTKVSPLIASILFASSASALVLFRALTLDAVLNSHIDAALGGWPTRHLSNSSEFGSHYVYASLFALNCFAAGYLKLTIFSFHKVSDTIRYLASFTFALYLMHRPLMNLYAFSLPYNPKNGSDIVRLMLMVLISVWLLGFVTEHRKMWWRNLFSGVLERLVRAIRAAPFACRLLVP